MVRDRPEQGCPHPDPWAALPEEPSFSPCPLYLCSLDFIITFYKYKQISCTHVLLSIDTDTCMCVHVTTHVGTQTFSSRVRAGGRGREACGYTASLPQPLRCALNPPVRDSGDPASKHSTASPSKKPMGLSKNQ